MYIEKLIFEVFSIYFKFMINNIKFTIVSILLLIASNIHAQKSLYKGDYTIEGIGKGYAEFDHRVKKKDTIFTGSFLFSKYIDEDDKRTVSYNGSFKKDQLNGKWEFSYKKIDSIGKRKPSDLSLLSQTSGEEFQLSAKFKNDLQVGQWSIIKQDYINSQPKDTTYRSSISFDDDHIKKTFKASGPEFDIKADFNDSGLIEGKLTIEHEEDDTKLKEVRVYKDGALEKHYFEIDGQKVFIDYLGLDQSKDEDQETWVDLPLNKEYIDVLRLANISSYQFDEIDEKLNVLSYRSSVFLVDALKEFYNYNSIDIWQSITQQAESRAKAEVSLRKYPLTSQEKTSIRQIKDDFKFITTTIDNFKNNKLTEIGIYQNRELNETVQIFDLIDSIRPQLKENVDILQSTAISFLDRSTFDNRIFSDVKFPENVNFDFQDKTVGEKTQLPVSFDADNFQISDYASYIKKIRVRVDELNRSAQKIINKLLKRSELNEIEEDLLAKKDRIIDLYRKQLNKDKFNNYHQNTASSIIDFTKKEFQNYATLNIDKKKEKIDQYLKCYDEVLSLYQLQKELPDKINRLEELYTRTVWNPYTYSDMDEIVKKRIYDAYQEFLLPLVLSKISSEINCQDIPKNIKNFNRLYKRMVELRELDTKELERDLKRKEDPQVIFQLLSIKYIK